MKISLVIEFETENDEDITARAIERQLEPVIDRYSEQHEMIVTHFEASEGSLKEAFGIEEV